jgi:S-formylglutathione hydrolase FrmB
MARLQIHTHEPDISMDVVVPEYLRSPAHTKISSKEYYSNRDLPVLWLLHGLKGNCSDWLRYSQIELFAEEKGLIVICPSAENGFYVNMAQGVSWEDNLFDKLWPLVHKMLPTSDKREKNFIAGVNMGGYGAVKLALDYPEFFCCAGSFDGWLEIPQSYANGTGTLPGLHDVFGNPAQVTGGPNDLYHLADELTKNTASLPEIYIDCGAYDLNYESNLRFYNAIRSAGYASTWITGACDNGWRILNSRLDKFINWLQFQAIS